MQGTAINPGPSTNVYLEIKPFLLRITSHSIDKRQGGVRGINHSLSVDSSVKSLCMNE
jgi:hypothetical protein